MPTEQSQDFDTVFAEITGEIANANPESTSSQTDVSTDSTPGDVVQPGEQSDGAGDSGESEETGGNPVVADGEGQSAGTNDDADSGDEGSKSEVDYVAKIAAMEAKLEAAFAPAPAQAAVVKEPELYTSEEVAEINELKGEWPDLFRMFTLLARQTESNVVKYTFSELGKVLGPLQQTVSTITGNEHVDAIYSAHADYDEVFDPCMKWVEKQPNFIRKACKDVIENGSAEEVSTMIQRFKDETQWKGKKPDTVKQKPTELSSAARQAAQAISAVGTKRGVVPSVQDPADFDSAWSEANAT